MGLHPDDVGRLSYPDFARYLDYYTDPERFIDGYFDREDAVNKLGTFHDIQQELIREAERKKMGN